MLRLPEIQNRLKECEQGVFQKVCNELLTCKGYLPYKLTGSVVGSNKTKKGTPDSVYKDICGNYIYVEITTEQGKLSNKITDDVKKCMDKINNTPSLKGKISKIIFLHNQENIDESITETIKQSCGKIKFDIYGIDTISLLLQNKYPQIAISELNMRDEHDMVTNISEESIEKIANAVNQQSIKQYENDTINEIKKKINHLYEAAITIVNTNDALVYISKDNKKKLEEIYNNLMIFDFYYKNKNDNDTKLYYHNMLVIISKVDVEKAIKFYNNMPESAKNNMITLHLYTMILIEKGDYSTAKSLLENLYLKQGCKEAFETLIRAYFLSKDYNKVISMLSSAKTEKFDVYGFLAAILIISKNEKRKYTTSEIMKLNNSKFRKMPMFYTCTAKILYNLNPKDKRYIEQFKKCFKFFQETDVIAIVTMCNQAIELGLEKEAIQYLEKIKLSPVLQNKLLELLARKKTLSCKEINLIEQISKQERYQDINLKYLNAKVLEYKGKELEAINQYRILFEDTQDINSGIKYIQLSIKNKSEIKEEIIRNITNFNTVETFMLTAEAFKYIGNINDALNMSYKAMYLSGNNSKYKEAFKQFWSLIIMNNNYAKPISNITSDCVVILQSDNKETKIILLEDNPYFEVGKTVLNAKIIRSNSELGIDLLHLSVGESIKIENSKFTIIETLHKYTYFAQKSFKYIENSKEVKTLKSPNDNTKDLINQIKVELKEHNNNINKRLDFYQEEKNLPLSALISNEKGFDEYIRLINTLLFENNRVLLAGETNDITLKKGFVVDSTALITLTLLNVIDVIPDDICKKIYITKSLKNKFDYFYQTLLKSSEGKESSLYLINEEKLTMVETQNIKKIQFWRKLNYYISKFTVVEQEAEKDDIYNDQTEKILDKVEFDLIELSKTQKLPFVSDDLFMRKISNLHKVNNTNSMQIIKEFSKNYETYLTTFITYSKSNYIYTLHNDELSEMLNNLYKNFTDKNKTSFLSVIMAVLENKVSFEYYAPILQARIDALKKVQYIEIFGNYCENLFATFYIESVGNIINKKCNEFKLTLKKI